MKAVRKVISNNTSIWDAFHDYEVMNPTVLKLTKTAFSFEKQL